MQYIYVTGIFKSNLLFIFELGLLPMFKSSTKISKVHAPTAYEHKFHKARIKNLPPIGFELGFPWLGTHSYNYW